MATQWDYFKQTKKYELIGGAAGSEGFASGSDAIRIKLVIGKYDIRSRPLNALKYDINQHRVKYLTFLQMPWLLSIVAIL